MMNPFKSKNPIDQREKWIGDQESNRSAFAILDDNVAQRINTVIMGVKGSGKTSLLRCLFTFDYCLAKAQNDHILICEVDLSNRADGEDVCNYLADQLIDSVDIYLGDDPACSGIVSKVRSVTSDSGATKLELIIRRLQMFHYGVTLVMDNFEHFTTSENVTSEHHDKLRFLTEQGSLYFVAATDSDLSEDTLPENVKGSYLLQKFTSTILLTAFDEKQAVEFMKKKLGDSHIISEGLMKTLYKLSGGVPWLLETAAECAYDNLEENNGFMDKDQTKKAIYEKSKPYLSAWCKYLTEPQRKVLRLMLENFQKNSVLLHRDFTGEQSELTTAVGALKARGILKQWTYIDGFGNIRLGADGDVCFNSLLLQRYFKEHLEEIEADRRKQEDAEKTEEAEKAEKAEVGEPTQIINNYNFYEGSKANLAGASDYSQTIHADQVQLHQEIGVSPARLMDMLMDSGDSKPKFLEKLSDYFHGMSGQVERPMLGEDDTDEAAQQYDIAYEEIGQQIVQDVEADEEGELLNVSPEGLLTLDSRFAEVRHIRPEITDGMLEKQSERCALYIKLSVIVEDALQFLNGIMGDFSPQLVLYGKALEQALRDDFYDLFHTRNDLYDFGNFLFRDSDPASTYIGNYRYAISEKKDRLCIMCQNYNLATDDGSK
jgi:hypothetical protein